MTVLLLFSGVKKALTVFGLLGTGIWALESEGRVKMDSDKTRANAEVLAEKGINGPFVRKSAPASRMLRSWQIGGEKLYSSLLGTTGWPDPEPTSLTGFHGGPD